MAPIPGFWQKISKAALVFGQVEHLISEAHLHLFPAEMFGRAVGEGFPFLGVCEFTHSTGLSSTFECGLNHEAYDYLADEHYDGDVTVDVVFVMIHAGVAALRIDFRITTVNGVDGWTVKLHRFSHSCSSVDDIDVTFDLFDHIVRGNQLKDQEEDVAARIDAMPDEEFANEVADYVSSDRDENVTFTVSFNEGLDLLKQLAGAMHEHLEQKVAQ